MKWKRYTFKTKHEDWRPAIFDERYPSYNTGEGNDYYTMVAWLPENEDLLKYWDDAYDIDYDVHDKIVFILIPENNGFSKVFDMNDENW
jgi:hypothetical protein